MDDLADLVRLGDLRKLRDWLEDAGTLDVAEALARLDPMERAIPFRLLHKDRALAVFEALDTIHQQQLLEGLRTEQVSHLITGLDPDDRARLVDEVPAKVAKRLLAGLDSQERQLTATLLGYPPESAGRVMTPEYVNVHAGATAAQALARVRRVGGDVENLHVLPVTDGQRKLVGVVDLPTIVTADPEALIGDLMHPDVYSVRADEDQEAAARLVQEADLVALPVVDSEDRLVGIVTFDDAMEILEAEETEDISRAAALQPLERPYFSVSVFHLARKRAMWLLILILAATLTVNVLRYFEHTLETVVTLALFVPLLIGTGGNSGAQASTIVIRAMAVGEVHYSDLPTIIWRETRVGIMLGAMLGAVGFPVVTFFFGTDIAMIVSLTLVAVCTWASFAGGMLPVLAKRLGIDPAVVSAPLITTLVDTTGLIIYFLIARAVLADTISKATTMSLPHLFG